MAKNKIEELQIISDTVCKQFGMASIPVKFNQRLTHNWGLYRYDRIELRSTKSYLSEICFNFVETLLHELAHHLQESSISKKSTWLC